ncbi:MAG: hypothetical protein M0T73_16670 [Deltaproteobacteria bacterium]|nr:hypothetical protein [Deltaproteobacteria bacterium]
MDCRSWKIHLFVTEKMGENKCPERYSDVVDKLALPADTFFIFQSKMPMCSAIYSGRRKYEIEIV